MKSKAGMDAETVRRVSVYTLAAYGFSWTVAAIMAVSGIRMGDPGFSALGLLYMCGPLFAAIFATRVSDRRSIRDTLGLRPQFNRALLTAWLTPILIVLVAMLAARFLAPHDMVSLESRMTELFVETGVMETVPAGTTIGFVALVITLLAFINTFTTMLEEAGWRGYLFNALEETPTQLHAAIVGILWGVWHFPITLLGLNFGHDPLIGMFLTLCICILLSYPMLVIRSTNGSTWSAALFHGTFNATGVLYAMSLVEPGPFWSNTFGIAGMIGTGCVVLLLLGLARRGERQKAVA